MISIKLKHHTRDLTNTNLFVAAVDCLLLRLNVTQGVDALRLKRFPLAIIVLQTVNQLWHVDET